VEHVANGASDLLFRVNGQTIGGKKVNTATLISDVGKRICEKYDTDVACMWFQTGPGTVVASLRGKNVRVIAEAFGGGGHEEAAGFQLKDWEQIKELLHGDLSADRIMVPSYHLGDTNGFSKSTVAQQVQPFGSTEIAAE
jgi:oligoribonuclease NrnB/cAMP/cGMP phosphodiesterase (DHH superfamily)